MKRINKINWTRDFGQKRIEPENQWNRIWPN